MVEKSDFSNLEKRLKFPASLSQPKKEEQKKGAAKAAAPAKAGGKKK
jgi:hypothetical protein